MKNFTDEKTLLREIKNGNGEAFEFLFNSYYPRLRGYAARFVTDEEAVRDIIQESFLRFWEKRDLIEAVSISSLLFAMVRNACLNYLKHLQLVEQHNLEHLDRVAGQEELYYWDFNLSPEYTLLYKELQQQISLVMSDLPSRCREVFEMSRFKKMKNREIAENLAMQILISVLKGDQNYHYENIAFVCNASGQILRLAPMIDHEFSTYFMFPDNIQRHTYWLDELKRSIEGKSVRPEEYKDFPNEKERRLMEKSATCLYRNLIYIKEHYPEVTATFLENVSRLKRDLLQKRESFFIQKAKDYPDYANSDAYLIGKARYKDHDEEKAAAYEKQYGREGKEISFDLMNCLINYEVQEIIEQMERILR